jgi:hypothetical protein
MTPTAQAVRGHLRERSATEASHREPAAHLLGACPSCRGGVVPDACAVRYRDEWYHLRCALDEREPARRG